MRLFQIFTVIFSLFAWSCVFADSDHQIEQSVMDSKNIVSLDLVLAKARNQFTGRVLKVELEDEDDAPSGFVYELKILKSDGSVVEVEYDAQSLKVLKVEGDDWQDRQIPSN